MNAEAMNNPSADPYRSLDLSAEADKGAGQRESGSSRSDGLSADADRRPRPGRAAWLRNRLSDRELAVLEGLYLLRLLRGDQVQRLYVYDGSEAARTRRTRALVKRLSDLGLVTRYPRAIGGIHAGSTAQVVALSGLGLAVLDRQGIYGARRRTVWETKPAFGDHVLAVAELYVLLAEIARGGEVELLDFDTEPAA